MSTALFLGTAGFDDPDPHAVLKLTLSHADGVLALGGEETKTAGRNPGWVCVPPGMGIAFVGMEDEAGSVQSYAISADDASKLTPLGAPQSSVGRHPCSLAVDSTRRWLLCANYSSGSVSVLPINEDGSVGAATDSKGHQGSELLDAALADRQEMAHCHCILPNPAQLTLDPDTQWVAVCDLGLSTVFIYELDTRRGTLIGAADSERHLRLAAGAGCRHCIWSADGTTLFVNNELDCTITVASFDGSTGTLTAKHTVDSLPVGVPGTRAHHRGNSDIQIHPNGRYLYVGIRSPDPGLIAVFAITRDGALELVQHEPTRGLVPRNFKLVPGAADALWLVVGNQETKSVVSFAMDNESGELSYASTLDTGPYKACNISFVA
jgi:6-phosphogluconolactonase